MGHEPRWAFIADKGRERVDPIDMGEPPDKAKGAPPAKTKVSAAKGKPPTMPPKVAQDFSLMCLPNGLLKDLAVHLKSVALVNDEYAYGAALFAFASILENRSRFQIGRGSLAHEALSLYLLLVGPPRRARKSTLMGSNVQRLVGRVVGRAFIDEFTAEAIHEELYCSETQSLSLYFDEFRTLVGGGPSYAAILDATITKMYNGEAWTRSIKSNKKKGDLTTQRTVEDFMVNVCGCTTAAWLFKNIERESFLSGFLLRFIPVYAHEEDPAVRLNADSPAEREAYLAGLPAVDLSDLLARLNAFHDILMQSESQVMVSLSPSASSLLAEFNAEMEPKRADDEIGSAILHGMTQNIRRVAALIQISRLADRAVDRLPRTLEVSVASMREALSFFRAIYPEALHMIRVHYHDSKQEAHAKSLLKDIQPLKPKMRTYLVAGRRVLGLAKADITRATRLAGSVREAALKELVEREILEGPFVIPSANPKARKPTSIYLFKRDQWE